MSTRSVNQTISAMTLSVFELYKQGTFSKEVLKRILSEFTDIAEAYGDDLDSVMALLGNRCSVCLEEVEDKELVSWSPDADYDADDIRSQYKQVAYDNCFGDEMVGGNVCLKCASKLHTVQDGLEVE